MLKDSSYSRMISVENFGTPNFPTGVEIPTWLIKIIDSRIDRGAALRSRRVVLIRAVTRIGT